MRLWSQGISATACWALASSAAVLLPLPVAAAAPAATAAPSPAAAASVGGVEAAIALRQQGDLQGAAQLLIARLEQQPFDARAHHELGVLYAATGQWQQAEARLSESLRLRPNEPATQLVLGDVLRANLRCLRAIPLYGAAQQTEAFKPAALRGQALCQLAAADLAGADQTLRALGTWANAQRSAVDAEWVAQKQAQLASLRDSPDANALQMETQGRALFDQKRYAEAQLWLQWALDAEPTADRAWRLAVAAAAADQLDEAAAAIQRALALDPSHGPARAAQDRILRGLRLRGRAPLATFGAPPDTGDPAARHAVSGELALARALLDGDLLLARNLAVALQKAAAPKPGVRLLLWSAEVYLRDKQLARAGQLLREAVALAPLHDGVRKLQAELAIRQGRGADARALLGLAAPGEPGEEDLQVWSALRRQEFDHQLRMRLDPGLRAGPPLQDQLAETLGRLRAARAAAEAARAAEAQAASTATVKSGGKSAGKPSARKRARP